MNELKGFTLQKIKKYLGLLYCPQTPSQTFTYFSQISLEVHLERVLLESHDNLPDLTSAVQNWKSFP